MRPFLRISSTEDHVVIKEQTVKLEAPFTGLCDELFISFRFQKCEDEVLRRF